MRNIKKMFTKDCWFLNLILSVILNIPVLGQDYHFDYKRYLFDGPSTLRIGIQSIVAYNVSGEDSKCPSIPFTWLWGDGNVSNGFFPQSHTYNDRTRNYLVKVIANYADGTKDSNDVLVRFVAPVITPIDVPFWITVKIPDDKPILGTRLYTIPPNLTTFQNTHFTIVSRAIIEYILSVCAIVEADFISNNVFLYNDKFEQIMLKDSADLRNEFRSLNFPIRDTIYNELYSSITSLRESGSAESNKFILDQNYPNPFNSITKIEFFLQHPVFVILKIFDILGQEIAVLLPENISSGKHYVQWDASEFSSGIYYYCLCADEISKTKQLVLLR